MSIFEDMQNLLNQEITAENESKEMTVLVRILSLIDAIAAVLYAVFFPHQSISVLIFFPLFVIANVCVLIATYHLRSYVTTTMHCLVLGLFITIFCLVFDSRLGQEFALFILIPLVYYRVDFKRIIKAAIALTCCALTCFLGLMGVWQPVSMPLSKSAMAFSVILNCLVITIKLIIVSLYYYRKFAAGESKIVAYSKKLEQLAGADALTGLSNRRSMEDHLNMMAEKYPTLNEAFSISIGDIDFFKKVNDTYGHDAGDYILTQLSTIFKNFMSGKGKAARWGGEEFLLVFDKLNGDEAFLELSKLRGQIERSEFQYKSNTIKITMTFGLEEYDLYAGIQETIAHADEKLYQGKHQGRNCIVY
ncbi:MAG: GGDEF domain-containing protein [Lachnospiraceae bacterium]|nr:GGDEF domain-containing protein [Lachnospiraceae bacterium]